MMSLRGAGTEHYTDMYWGRIWSKGDMTLEGDGTTSIEGAEVTRFCKLFYIRAVMGN